MELKREALAAALAATTKDQTQYHLDAVCVRADGAVEGTNGVLCVRVAPPEGAEGPGADVLIPSDGLRAVLKSLPRKSRTATDTVVTVTAEGATADSGLSAAAVGPGGKEFPSVIPSYFRREAAAGDVTLGLTLDMLETLIDVIKGAGGNGLRVTIPAKTVRNGDVVGAMEGTVTYFARPAVCDARVVFMGTRR